jgi:adenosylcobinamide-phosphate synthase
VKLGRPSLLAAAVAIDLFAGDPPDRFHPVSLFGRVAQAWEGHTPGDRLARLAFGGLGAVVLPAGYALAGVLLAKGSWRASPLVEVLLLKSTFAVRGLVVAGGRVADALEANDLPSARRRLRWLVSRDADSLDRRLILSATVESLAENATDAFLSPWFYYAVAGLPGALAYRAVNTLDSMWGYRTDRYEHFGKVAARLDDLANYLPASAGPRLLLAAGQVAGLPAADGLRILRRDGGRTESPNAGRMMSAMAGLLGVRLEKPGAYTLGDDTRALDVSDVRTAQRLLLLTAALGLAMTMGLAWLMERLR